MPPKKADIPPPLFDDAAEAAMIEKIRKLDEQVRVLNKRVFRATYTLRERLENVESYWYSWDGEPRFLRYVEVDSIYQPQPPTAAAVAARTYH